MIKLRSSGNTIEQFSAFKTSGPPKKALNFSLFSLFSDTSEEGDSESI